MTIKTMKVSVLKVVSGLLKVWAAFRAASLDFAKSSARIEPIRRFRLVVNEYDKLNPGRLWPQSSPELHICQEQ